mmetsp:Transcript_121982/g.304390  ORF Transcript_121982/g.304390 Transcript_121982/m.304390 type:complete len:725 (+) Transcript_121982:62-2236(+)
MTVSTRVLDPNVASIGLPEFLLHAAHTNSETDAIRNPRAPKPCCEAQAIVAATASRDVRKTPAALESCLICCQASPRYAAVGRCGHAEVCWLCAVRLRGLLRDFRCPVCKEELPEVALVSAGDSGSSAASNAGCLRHEKFGLVFGSDEIRREVESLFDYSCWLRSCRGCSFPTLKKLEKHIWEEHGRKFCHTCLLGRRVFLHEQLLYCQEDLERHHREGDGSHLLGRALPSLPPHAACGFCRRSFYSQDHLLEHMQKRHHLCMLCERRGRRGEYYRDYGYLSLHYEEQHYVCTHEDCRRGPYRIVAFNDEGELRVHEAAEHSALDKGGRGKKQGARLNLQMGAVSYREEQERRRQGQGVSNPRSVGVRNASAQDSAGEISIRFMWTRGQPRKAPAPAGEPGFAGEASAGGPEQSDDEEALYPTRLVTRSKPLPVQSEVAGFEIPRAISSVLPCPAPQTATDQSKAASSSGPMPKTTRSSVQGSPRPVRLIVLDVALRSIADSGLDIVEGLEISQYREQNRCFKIALEDACGVEEFARFKEYSAKFRRSLADAKAQTVAADAKAGHHMRTYADQVLDVFARICQRTDERKASDLLRDLVVLLPDKTVRRALHRELVDVSTQPLAATGASESVGRWRDSAPLGAASSSSSRSLWNSQPGSGMGPGHCNATGGEQEEEEEEEEKEEKTDGQPRMAVASGTMGLRVAESSKGGGKRKGRSRQTLAAWG